MGDVADSVFLNAEVNEVINSMDQALFLNSGNIWNLCLCFNWID